MSRPDLCPLARAVVLDLLTDARCAYRDARHFPNSAPELIPYGDRCRAEARALRNGAPYRINRHGWPELLEA
jgi:hypothetical protein